MSYNPVNTANPSITQNNIKYTTNIANNTFDVDLSNRNHNNNYNNILVGHLINKIHQSFDYNCAKSMITALFVGLLASALGLGTVLVLKDFHVIHIASSQLPKLKEATTLVGIGAGFSGIARGIHSISQNADKNKYLRQLEQDLGLDDYIYNPSNDKAKEQFRDAIFKNGITRIRIHRTSCGRKVLNKTVSLLGYKTK